MIQSLPISLGEIPEIAGRPQGAPLRQLAALWIRDHLTAVAPGTLRTHARARALCDAVAHPLDDHPAPCELAIWMRELQESGRYGSPRSIIGLRGCLSVWYTYGTAMGCSLGNPASPRHPAWQQSDAAARRDERFREPITVADKDLPALLAPLSQRQRALVLTGRTLGLRPGEALGLIAWGRQDDFQTAPDGSLQVRIARMRNPCDPGWKCQPLKKGERGRTLPVPADLARELLPLRAERPLVRVGRGVAVEPSDFLFPLGRREIGALNKLLQSTGLVAKGRGLYVLRHAFAGAQAASGAPIYEVQKAMGHCWSSTTQGYYERAGVRAVATPALMARGAPTAPGLYRTASELFAASGTAGTQVPERRAESGKAPLCRL